MNDQVLLLLSSSVLIEAIVEAVKPIWTSAKINWNYLLSLVLGVVVALLSGADIFEVLNIPLDLTMAGEALTGIIIARGAGYVHDVVKRIRPGPG